MTRLALVNYGGWPFPPLGLAYLASYLRKYLDFDDTIIIDSEKKPLKSIVKWDPDVVGFTSSTPYYTKIKGLAKSVKDKVDVPTLLGGPHITSLPHTLPKEFDIGIIGEGEETMRELMQLFLSDGEFRVSKFKRVSGIVFHENGKVKVNQPRKLIEPLDRIPYPARDLLDMKRYLPQCMPLNKRIKAATMLTSRGCSYRCIYCQAAQQWGYVRFHSAHYVVKEIKLLVEEYKVGGINIVDDIFSLNKGRLKDLVGLLKKEGLNKKITFHVNGRANLLDSETFRLLNEMNVKEIAIGFESCSEKILKYLKRGTVTVDQNEKATLLSKKHGVLIDGQFMLGSPGETTEDMMKTLHFIKTYPLDFVHLSITTPLPGTELWEYAKSRGLVSDHMGWDKLNVEPTPGLRNNVFVNDKMSNEEFLKIYRLFEGTRDVVNLRTFLSYSPFQLLSLQRKAIFNPLRVARFILKMLRASKFTKSSTHKKGNGVC